MYVNSSTTLSILGADGRLDEGRPGLAFEDMGPFEPVPMAKGDVLIYDNFMPHRSGTNATDSWRGGSRRARRSARRSRAAAGTRSRAAGRSRG